MSKSNYIPKQKQQVKLSFWQKLHERIIPMSFYVWKIKVTLEHTGGGHYHFGFTVLPAYKQFEFNFGRYVLNFWYRKDLIK